MMCNSELSWWVVNFIFKKKGSHRKKFAALKLVNDLFHLIFKFSNDASFISPVMHYTF